MTDPRTVSAAVAAAVATTAAEEGLARTELTELVQQVHDAMWRPEYPPDGMRAHSGTGNGSADESHPLSKYSSAERNADGCLHGETLFLNKLPR